MAGFRESGLRDPTILNSKYSDVPGYVPVLPNTTTEARKGFQVTDGVGHYVSGNETNILTFKYKIEYGHISDVTRYPDINQGLNVKSLSFANGYIYSPITDLNVSTVMPV